MFQRVHDNLKPGGCFAFIAVMRQPDILLQLGDLMGTGRAQQINEKFDFNSCEYYESLATETGFTIEFMDPTPSRISFPSVSSLMEWWFATTHGMFNPQLVDSSTSDMFTTTYYDGKNVEFDIPITKIVLKKC